MPKGFLQGLVLCFFLLCFFLVFFEFFWFLDSEAFIGYRASKKTKNQRNQKKQSLGKNVVPKGFLQGIGFLVRPRVSSRVLFFWFLCFFWLLWFFGVLRVFLVFRLGTFIGYRADKKSKKIEESKKNKENKKTKSWEKCCAQGFPAANRCFWFLCFFSVSLKLFGFVFLILWHICLT